MLDRHTGLGVYILVLANAAYDADLWAQLSPALARRHAELAAALTDTLRRGSQPADPDDDVLVFLKLNTIGFEHLAAWKAAAPGRWDVMFNPLRALRPPRVSGMKFAGPAAPLRFAGFHFNKPFLAKENSGKANSPASRRVCFTTSFPSPACTACWRPSPCARCRNILTPGTARLGLGPVRAIRRARPLPRLQQLRRRRLGQPSAFPELRAGAVPCRCRIARFAHNGGAEPYPLPCQRFTDPAEAWLELDRLHQRNTPYNLVYGRGCLHLVARVPQDSDKLNAQSRGYGWSEMAGAVTLFSRDAYEGLNAAEFAAELACFAR